MAAQSGSRIVVYAALAGNFLIAVTKFIAAAFTGSSAMLSEGVHSLVDTGNELLLLYGLHRAAKPPDREHPFGHGRELYFWSFVVAVLIFALGAGVSIYEGVRHVMQPEPMENATVNYIVLGLSIVFETASWLVALREFRREKGELGYLAAIRESKDPTTFTVLVEDSVAFSGSSSRWPASSPPRRSICPCSTVWLPSGSASSSPRRRSSWPAKARTCCWASRRCLPCSRQSCSRRRPTRRSATSTA
ncbi:cation diffusion facilitator family transporter [Devosia sp.]|uniref:cation diffusion facilitator family transporter n=1 Tax=Devosia sp. TaxID=1871048 RepID=UPI0034454004